MTAEESTFQAEAGGTTTQREMPRDSIPSVPNPTSDSVPPVSTAADKKVQEPPPAAGSLHDELREIRACVARIEEEFRTKIEYDAHKNAIIDRLHAELQEHKGDLLRSMIEPVVLDLTQTWDNLQKLAAHYRDKTPSDVDVHAVLRLIADMPGHVEDVLVRQGVTLFQCDTDTFDPRRQRVVRTVPTGDQAQDRKVAERVRKGFEWVGRVIRPEMVAVYIYHAESPSGESAQNDGRGGEKK